MKKKLLAILLAMCLIASLVPLGAMATDPGGLSVSKTAAKAGDEVTITFSVPGSASKAVGIEVNVTFDKDAFEVTAYEPPTLNGGARMYSAPADSNTVGKLTVTYSGDEGDATIDFSNGLTFTATLKVLNAATAGEKEFKVTKYDAYSLDEDGYTEIDLRTAGYTAAQTVSIYSELTSVNVPITAPVKNGVPQAAIAETDQYTGEITWTPDTEPFAANTVYTANVTLTCKEGYRFAAGIKDSNVTVTGATISGTAVSEDGGLSFKAAFPATADKELIGIEVTKNPDKMVYEHGDSLSKLGMVVTASYDDGSTEPNYAFTVEYPSGTCLRYGDTSVTIAYGGKTATLSGLTVGKKTLVIEGLTATDRQYDGTTEVELSRFAVTGVVSGDDISASAPNKGTVADANVGNDKPVTIEEITLGGESAGFYTIEQPTVTVNITKADLTADFFTITEPTDKTYDGEPATVPAPVLAAPYESEGLELSIFANGTKIETAPTDAGTYTINFDVPNGGVNFNSSATKIEIGTLTITAKDVTITGVAAENKTYDGTTDATVSGEAVINGKVEGDDVTVANGTAAFANQYVGENKAVTFTGFALSGSKAANYNLTAQPEGVTANITPADQTPVIKPTATLVKGGNILDLSTLVSGAQGEASFAIASGDAATLEGAVLTSDEEKTGEVVINVTITGKDLNGDGTNEYNAYTADAAITVNVTDKAVQAIAFAEESVTKTYSDADFTITAEHTEGDGEVTYSSSNEDVATVDPATGTVTINGAGTAIITATAAETNLYAKEEAIYSLTVNKATVTVTATNKNITVGGAIPAFDQPELDKDYTVSGLKQGEELGGTITLKYQKDGEDVEPDANETGTYDIVISGGEVPNADNYETEIVYVNGKLSITSLPPVIVANEYTVTVEETEHGTVTAEPASGAEGTEVKLTVTPDEGYELDTITASAGELVKVSDTEYTLKMPAENVTVTAKFKHVSVFTDVSDNAWYNAAVYYCYDNGYFKGVTKTEFAPGKNMNRAMFATVLYRIAGEPEVTGENKFADVAEGAWYYDAVVWAASEGIVKGYSSDKFGPLDDITREQIVVILWRYSGMPEATADLTKFGDADKISSWALDAVTWAVSEGILKGNSEGMLKPKDNSTRAEVAQIIMNYFAKAE